MQVSLPEGVEQLGLAPRARVAAQRALEAHRRSLGVVGVEVEAGDVDLVIDEPSSQDVSPAAS